MNFANTVIGHIKFSFEKKDEFESLKKIVIFVCKESKMCCRFGTAMKNKYFKGVAYKVCFKRRACYCRCMLARPQHNSNTNVAQLGFRRRN